MFVLSFLYPRPKHRSFDYEYHRQVHLPLGVAITHRTLNIVPQAIHIERVDAANNEPSLAAIAHVLFSSKHDRDLFATLFGFPDAAKIISADWQNYTEDPPLIRIGEWTTDSDTAAMIENYERHLNASVLAASGGN
jgi:hypothetical protein